MTNSDAVATGDTTGALGAIQSGVELLSQGSSNLQNKFLDLLMNVSLSQTFNQQDIAIFQLQTLNMIAHVNATTTTNFASQILTVASTVVLKLTLSDGETLDPEISIATIVAIGTILPGTL